MICLKDKKANGETISQPLVILIVSLIVVVLIIFAIFYFDIPKKIKETIPGFGQGEENDLAGENGDTVSSQPAGGAIGLYVHEHWILRGFNDEFYFIWDKSASSLRVAMDINALGTSNWYLDPENYKPFREGTDFSSETKQIIKNIMAQKNIDDAAKAISQASERTDIVSYTGIYGVERDFVENQKKDPIDSTFAKNWLLGSN